jgi:hypothetical protein
LGIDGNNIYNIRNNDVKDESSAMTFSLSNLGGLLSGGSAASSQKKTGFI